MKENESLDMNERIDALGKVLRILQELRENDRVLDGESAVEWVIDQAKPVKYHGDTKKTFDKYVSVFQKHPEIGNVPIYR